MGVVGPDLPPYLDGEGGEGQQVSSRGVEVVSGLGQQVTGVVQEAVELGLDGCCVGLVVNRVEHGLEGRPGALGGHCHQVGGVVGAAALPGRSGQVRGDGLDQTRVGVRGDKSYPSQASGDQVGEELVPRCSALAGVATRRPRTSRCPSALTPVAVRTTALTTRPPSRTFRVRASAATKMKGPASPRGRLRKEATCSSSSAAMRETCDFESELMPKVPISLSMRRVETPAR